MAMVLTFSTSFVGGISYTPQSPDDISSYTWSLPSVTVTTDALSAGNVMLTIKLSCGYTFTSPVLAIARPPLPPTFGSNPFAICNNSTNTFNVIAPCGATGYTWTLSGNAGATFQASGTQSLTTPSTSAVVLASTVGNSNATLSVAATYPGNVSSTAASYNIVTGILPAPTEIIPHGGINGEKLTPGSQADFTSVGANLWTVSPGSTVIQTSNNGNDILVQVTSATSGNVTVTAFATDACGTSAGFSQVYALQPGSGTAFYHSALPDSASGLGIAPLPLFTSPVLYPNPATGSVQVFIPGTDFTKTFIKLYDISGHLLQMIIPTTQNTLVDVSHRAKGLYIVEIFDGKQSMTKKLITQ